MRRTCPVCAASELRPMFRRAAVPVHQNRLAPSRDEARCAPRGELALVGCARCGLVFNRAFDPSLVAYGPGYENDQTASPAFARHLEERVSALVRGGVRGQEILEIGCGTGDFLRQVCRAGENRGRGFDPAAVPAVFPDGRGVRIEARWFEASGDGSPGADAVVCRHVLEHAPEPMRLLRLAREALAARSAARLYLELPALEWIAESGAMWDFFYEHASYFTEPALRNALALAGMRAVAIERVFAGQYLWVEAAVAGAPLALSAPAADDLDRLESIGALEARTVDDWRRLVAERRRLGHVAVWGAGAKGATFLHLVDADGTAIAAAVDVHPAKQGRFVPGTGHAVLAPAAPELASVRTFIVMNPNYRTEIEREVRALGLDARVHPA
jgi:SAM-dependent methyltransferase